MKKIALAAIALIGLTAPAFAGSPAGPARLIQTMHLVDGQPAAHDLVVPVHARKFRSYSRRYSRPYYASPYRGGFLGFRGGYRGYGGYRGAYAYGGGYGYRGGYRGFGGYNHGNFNGPR